MFRSLKGRLLLASAILIPLACGLLGWSLDAAHRASLLENQKQQLTLQSYALMAAAELEGSRLVLPPVMADTRLNQLASGLYAYVIAAETKQVIWRSQSSFEVKPPNVPQQKLQAGEQYYGQNSSSETPLFSLLYRVDWEDAEGTLHPYIFAIYESQGGYLRQLEEYRQTLWLWLIGTSIVLLCLQIATLLWGLRPMNKVVDDLKQVQSGSQSSLQGDYPLELSKLTDSINRLLEHERKQRERYRHTQADLAHSIKNPVAVIHAAVTELQDGEQKAPLKDIAEQCARIDQLVSYHLTRAVGQSAAPFQQAFIVAPHVHRIVAAMDKVYAEKTLNIEQEIENAATFRGDEGDLLELLGNLVDNACKYCEHAVSINVSQSAAGLNITIEDDGPGISANLRESMLKRGQRADSRQAGQGIGLAVVEDIVQSYDGTLTLLDSTMGGLKVQVVFSGQAIEAPD